MKANDYVFIPKDRVYGIVKYVDKNGKCSIITPDGERRIKEELVEYIPPIKLTKEDLKDFVTGNADYYDNVSDPFLVGNYQCDENYEYSFPDIIEGLDNLRNCELAKADDWYVSLIDLKEVLFNNFQGQETSDIMSPLCLDDLDFFAYVDDRLAQLIYQSEDEVFHPEEIIQEIENYLDEKDLPFENHRYPDPIAMEYIMNIDKNQLYDRLSSKETELFKRLINQLIDADNQEATALLADCYYGGNAIYDCDYEMSRELYTELYERYGEPGYANSLGYIYYYGRGFGGRADYQKAFEYFSAGSAAECRESMIKLGDMFKEGYGTTRNVKLADYLYHKAAELSYHDLLEDIRDNYADATVRLGDMDYARGLLPAALLDYLHADFGMRKRISENRIGDDGVYRRIQKGIAKCFNDLNFEVSKKIVDTTPRLIDNLISDRFDVHIIFNRLSSGKLKITANRLIHKEDLDVRPELIAFIDFAYCELTDTVELIGDANTLFIVDEIGQQDYLEFTCDAMEMKDEGNMTYFYYRDNLVCGLHGNNYEVKCNKELAEHGEYRKLVSIVPSINERPYEYLCDEDTDLGDMVTYMVLGKVYEGIVIDKYQLRESRIIPAYYKTARIINVTGHQDLDDLQ